MRSTLKRKAPAAARFHSPADGKTQVTLKIARHAIWLLGDHDNGEDGGGFITRLWSLMTVADETNLALLARIYPGYVEAFEAGMRTSWGLEWLRNKVLDAKVAARG